MGLLDGQIAKAIFKGFKGRLLKGELRREVPSTVLDSYGDPTAVTLQYTSVEGFTASYSESYRLKAGIPDTDLKVNIFAQSAPNLTPNKDDIVQFRNRWYQLRKVKIDPADALWVCQAFAIDPPVDAS